MDHQEFVETVKKPAREAVQAAHRAWLLAWEAWVAIEDADWKQLRGTT